MRECCAVWTSYEVNKVLRTGVWKVTGFERLSEGVDTEGEEKQNIALRNKVAYRYFRFRVTLISIIGVIKYQQLDSKGNTLYWPGSFEDPEKSRIVRRIRKFFNYESSSIIAGIQIVANDFAGYKIAVCKNWWKFFRNCSEKFSRKTMKISRKLFKKS